jgi:superoxide reductase
MTKLKEIYRCRHCGNIVEVLHEGGGTLVCCGEPMQLLDEKTAKEEGKEKHVPIIEKTADGVKVKVGSVEHPMTKEHYIEWIDVIDKGKSCKKFLKPGDSPEAKPKAEVSKNAIVKAYCNLHGLWKSTK